MVRDLTKYVLFNVIDRGVSRELIYDKRKKTAFTTSGTPSCDTTSYKTEIHKVSNDIFGLNSITLMNYSAELNLTVYPVDLVRVSEEFDLDCLRQKRVLQPKKRDQLLDMVENQTGEELPVLVLMHLK